jgi:chemosensory pili system protein ChpA (sensor histidine kinase/response regulator)
MMDNDTFDNLPGDELTDEDRAILAAFDAVDLSVTAPLPAEQAAAGGGSRLSTPIVDEDMQVIFVEEVAIDCITLEQVLAWRPASERSPEDAAQAQIVQRIAHKLKGTCGAMHCDVLAALALHTETLTKLIEHNDVEAQVGWQGLDLASHALQETLEDFAAAGRENPAFLTAFEDRCHELGIELRASPHGRDEAGDARPFMGRPFALAPFVHADAQRVDTLLGHTERLASSSTLVARALAAVESAFQELHAAEERLRRLEIRITNHLTLKSRQQEEGASAEYAQEDDEEHSTSSLVERILAEATRRTGRFVPRRALFPARELGAIHLVPVDGDELVMDRFKEESLLALSLREVVADVSIAASQLRVAFAQLTLLLREQAAQVARVRDDSLLLSLTPLDILLKRIEQEVARENRNQPSPVQCEVKGEATEIDQEIVEQLALLLLQLIRASLATYTPPPSNAAPIASRMWLHVQGVGSDVLIEVGFSMDVAGGAFEEVVAGIHALDGEIEPRRNVLGGISYHLRLPRSRGTVHAIILRERGHSFAIPLAQIERAALSAEQDAAGAPPIALSELLALPAATMISRLARPAVYLTVAPDEQSGKDGRDRGGRDKSDLSSTINWEATNREAMGAIHRPLRIQVDEVVGNAVLIVRPLPAHLQRPGIAGAAIDGANNVLPLLDLPELLRQCAHDLAVGADVARPSHPPADVAHPSPAPRPRTVIVVDDSVSMRQFLHQLLTNAAYQVFDARDGIQALELLQLHLPDALILDVEMPNLNGYDVLSRLRAYPELESVKIVMLTSRFTEKHQERARVLGAHAYLTKPCDPDILLETLERLLTARFPRPLGAEGQGDGQHRPYPQPPMVGEI